MAGYLLISSDDHHGPGQDHAARVSRERAVQNETFDAGLRRDNPEWGVRDTADLKKLGETNRLRFAELIEMPANNAVLVFIRA